MFLGSQHRPLSESLEVEFKEFCLNEHLISDDHIYEIVKNGKIKNKETFNKEIYKNIKHYFYKYIPKYTSAFVNANINGNLIFGVNDFGEITGIPFFGTKNELQEYINNISIKHLLKSDNNSYKIVLSVEQLIIDINYLDNQIDNLLKEYYANVKKRNCIIQKYKNDRLDWCNKMYEYTCNLPLLISSKKEEFEKYLEIHSPKHLNYTLKHHEMKNIRHLKSNPEHYIHWLMKFKELNLQKLKNIKPILPELPKIKNGPIYLYKHLTHLRYNLVKNNKHIKYFIININVKIQKKCLLSFYDIDKNVWAQKFRKLHKNTPACI